MTEMESSSRGSTVQGSSSPVGGRLTARRQPTGSPRRASPMPGADGSAPSARANGGAVAIEPAPINKRPGADGSAPSARANGGAETMEPAPINKMRLRSSAMDGAAEPVTPKSKSREDRQKSPRSPRPTNEDTRQQALREVLRQELKVFREAVETAVRSEVQKGFEAEIKARTSSQGQAGGGWGLSSQEGAANVRLSFLPRGFHTRSRGSSNDMQAEKSAPPHANRGFARRRTNQVPGLPLSSQGPEQQLDRLVEVPEAARSAATFSGPPIQGTGMDAFVRLESPQFEQIPESLPARTLMMSERVEGFSREDTLDMSPRAETDVLLLSGTVANEGRNSVKYEGPNAALLLQDEPTVPKRRGCLACVTDFVQTETFDHLVGTIILMNAIVTGIQTEYMAQNWLGVVPPQFAIWDHIFCGIFTVEMMLRWVSYGPTFWNYCLNNWLDCGVVVFQIFDETVSLFSYLSSHSQTSDTVHPSHSASALRIVRVFRLVRILRFTRLLSVIGELRMLVVSILDSFRALVWMITLIWLIIYMFAVFFTQLVTDFKVHHEGKLSEEDLDALLTYYGSLGNTMIYLYEATCDGRHWDSMLDPLTKSNVFFAILFVIYISISIIGVMNMVTSVFVTTAMQKVEEDKKEVLFRRMTSFFEEADDDNSGTISWAEFQEHMQHPQFQKYLKEIDLNAEHGKQLFHLLDVEETGDVAIEDIVSGCVRLHGPAKALDHANLMTMVERLLQSFKSHQQEVADALGVVQAAVCRVAATKDRAKPPEIREENAFFPEGPGCQHPEGRASQ